MAINKTLLDASRRRLYQQMQDRKTSDSSSSISIQPVPGPSNTSLNDPSIHIQPVTGPDSSSLNSESTSTPGESWAERWEDQFGRPTQVVPEDQRNNPQTAPGQDSFGSKPFSFDAGYNEQMNQIREQEAALRSQEELQRRRMAEDRQSAVSEGERYRDDALKGNTESMADRGLVHSGINIEAQQDIGEDFIRYTDEIQKAFARGEEDLAQFLTQQRNQLEAQRTAAKRERAEKEAMRRELDSLNEAINSTPQPNVAGRYDIQVKISDKARELHEDSTARIDHRYLNDSNELAGRVEAIFNNRQVALAGLGHETDAQRLARITGEVARGERTLDDVRGSVDALARRQYI